MSRLAVVIDDIGEVWAPNSPVLIAKHSGIGSKSDLVTYLIRNSGFIRVEISLTFSSARIVFRSGRIGTRAIRAATRMLWAAKPERFVIELVGPMGSLHASTELEEVAAMLAHHSCEDSILKRPAYYLEQLPLRYLQFNRRLRVLRATYRRWLRTKGVFADNPRLKMLSNSPDRQIVARFSEDTAYFDQIGCGYPMLNSSIKDLDGKQVDKQFDAPYGSNVAKDLLKVEFRREPVLALVEATIALPESRPKRVRYERLMLPWLTKAGIVVSSASSTRTLFASCEAT